MSHYPTLPELVRDSKLEASFRPNALALSITVHRKVSGRQTASTQEVWRRIKILGQGGYGTVWLEQKKDKNQNTPRFRAVKQISLPVSEIESGRYIRELEALAKFSLEKYRECFVRSYGWYETPRRDILYIAMEYCEHGDLKRYLAAHGNVSEDEAKDITRQILQGLWFMHDNGIAHRDLKPANILIKSKPPDEWWIKICDLGLSKRINDDSISSRKGTPGFMPPEMLSSRNENTDPFPGDIWCLGEIVFNMLTSQPTFPDFFSLFNYQNGNERFPLNTLRKVSASTILIEFIQSLMTANPAARLTVTEAKEHEWMTIMSSRRPQFSNSAAINNSTGLTDHSSTGAITQVTGEWTMPIETVIESPTSSQSTVPSGSWTVAAQVDSNNTIKGIIPTATREFDELLSDATSILKLDPLNSPTAQPVSDTKSPPFVSKQEPAVFTSQASNTVEPALPSSRIGDTPPNVPGLKGNSAKPGQSLAAAEENEQIPPNAVQRKVKAALNKMTPNKFDKIAGDIMAIASQAREETDGRTLRQVIYLICENAFSEPQWGPLHAKLCHHMLQNIDPGIRDENFKGQSGQSVAGRALVRKYLLNYCQEQFERSLPTKPAGNTKETEGTLKYYVAAAVQRRGFNLIHFIGELFKLDMVTLRIMHECVSRLLDFEGIPDEVVCETLAKLLRTVGPIMEADPRGIGLMNTYIDRISRVINTEGFPSRSYYMLLDTVDLRKKQWKS